jgi:class 3 adenylate cyclase
VRDAPYRSNPWTLAFVDPTSEMAYQRDFAERSKYPMRLIFVVALIIVASFDAVDAQLAPEQHETLRLLRFGVILPLHVVTLALSWSDQFWRVMQSAVIASVVGSYAALVWTLVVFPATVFGGPEGSVSQQLLVSDAKFLFLLAVVLLHDFGLIAMGVVRFVPGLILLAATSVLAFVGAWLLEPTPLASFFGMWVCLLTLVIATMSCRQLALYRRHDFAQSGLLDLERAKSDALLRNILPEPIAAHLKDGTHNPVHRFSDVTVMFADIEGFTVLSEQLEANEVVDLLNTIFSAFDVLVEKYGVEKIKTIGDAYMVAAGVPEPRADHAEAIAELALEMQRVLRQFSAPGGHTLRMRIGMHSGPVVAGVIGARKFAYDLWGDTVNTAARMESHGETGRIHVGPTTAAQLGERFELVARGDVFIKGKGTMQTHFLEGQRPCQGHPT